MIPGLSVSTVIDSTWTVLASTAWKSAVLLLLALGATWLLRRRSAAARHLVWTVAMAALLAFPVLETSLPAWHVPVAVGDSALHLNRVAAPEVSEAPQAVAAGTPGTAAIGTEVLSEEPLSYRDLAASPTVADENDPMAAALSKVHSTGAGTSGLASWRTGLVAIWLLGAAWMFARLGGGIVRLQWLGARSSRITAGHLAQELEMAAREMRVDCPVILLVGSEPTMPMTWGWRKPRLLLPQGAESWSAERARVVLSHELAHVVRGDYAWQLVGSLARALFWFHPLVWLGFEKMKIEQEQASDDLVLAAGADAMAYASELLQVTSQLGMPRVVPSAALAMGRLGHIRRRLESILDESRDRKRIGRRSVCVLSAAGAVLAAVIASFQGFQLQAADRDVASSDAIPANVAAAADGGATDQKLAAQKDGSGAAATSQAESRSRLTEIRTRILQSSVKALDERALDEAAIRGMLQSLNDPHSEFLPKQQLIELTRSLTGELMGIGAQLAVEEKQLTIITPLPGSPARQAGLKPGDAILAVDGKPVAELGASAAIASIRGSAGTVVELQVKRAEGAVESVKVTRGAIRMPFIKGVTLDASGKWNHWLDEEAKLGYVEIVEFGKQTAADCRTALMALMQQGLKGLVVDLRHCPGGMLDAVADTANLLLNEGKIVTVKGGRQPETGLSANGSAVIGNVPLLVLIDERTASAAEILAGALKDNGRATLLGTRTFGKGSVQSILPVDGEEAIRLTTAYFYLPGGRNIDRQAGANVWGVDPSDGFYVPVTAAQQDLWRKRRQRRVLDGAPQSVPPKGAAAIAAAIENDLADPQLAAAYKSLAARVSSGTFLKVGKSEGEMLAYYTRRETLLKQKAEALKQLETIEQELTTEAGAKK